MALYSFDLRDGNELVIDEEGMELRDTQAEAGRALAGVAWDAMRVDGAQGQQMVIEVRDAQGPVMEVKFSFEIAASSEASFVGGPTSRQS
jgi:hypothetical protein